MKKTIAILIFLIAVGGIFAFIQYDGEKSNLEDVSIMSEFPTKIVYTTDASADPEPMKADCARRGGTFNACGSMCAPDAEVCATVCAFVCELGFRDGWTIYTNETVGFSVRHPKNFDIHEDMNGQFGPTVSISVWGPTQIEGSEFFDGVSMSFTRRQLSGQTLKELAEEQETQLAQVGQVTEKLQTIVLVNREGYTFFGEGVGAPHRRIFLPLGNLATFDISITVGDPTNQGYQDMADRMLESFAVTNAPEANIKVYSPENNAILGTKFIAKGEARVFENTVLYRLKDDSGLILAEGFVTADAPDIGQFGSFEFSTGYITPTRDSGALEVYTQSAKDGSEIDKVIIPVQFAR